MWNVHLFRPISFRWPYSATPERECTIKNQGGESLCDNADWKHDKADIEGVQILCTGDASGRLALIRGLQVRSDQSFNRRSVVSGQFKFRAIIEYHGILAFVLWPKFLDPFGIH